MVDTFWAGQLSAQAIAALSLSMIPFLGLLSLGIGLGLERRASCEGLARARLWWVARDDSTAVRGTYTPTRKYN